MKKQLFPILFILLTTCCNAQCPNLNGAMINACGVSEGLNEFVLFTTATSASVNNYIVNYGTANPPVSNRMSGVDARTKTGAGVISATGCTINTISDPTTSIPAGSKVIFIPAGTDNNYDLTAVCASGSLYVVYINTVAPITGTTSWASGGVLANTATTARFLQVTNSASASCTGALAPVSSYIGSSFAANLDGNFVTWNTNVPSYSNNGCNSIALPVSAISLQAIGKKNYNTINWQTIGEVNVTNFIVEKSTDGVNFLTIGNVAANGNNSSYTFNDFSVESKSVFYRIVVVNIDGKKSNSDIAKLINVSVVNDVVIYPKLAQANLTLEWYNSVLSNTNITIMDAVGRIVLQKSYNNNIGFAKKDIDIATLKTGQYFVRIINGDKKITDSFIKQ